MRLIDADEFAIEEPKLWDWSSLDDISSTAVLKQCIWDVQCAPTVEAIPVKWIKEQLQKAVDFTHHKSEGKFIDNGCVVEVVSASFTANVLLNLLENWEKDVGQNKYSSCINKSGS